MNIGFNRAYEILEKYNLDMKDPRFRGFGVGIQTPIGKLCKIGRKWNLITESPNRVISGNIGSNLGRDICRVYRIRKDSIGILDNIVLRTGAILWKHESKFTRHGTWYLETYNDSTVGDYYEIMKGPIVSGRIHKRLALNICRHYMIPPDHIDSTGFTLDTGAKLYHVEDTWSIGTYAHNKSDGNVVNIFRL